MTKQLFSIVGKLQMVADKLALFDQGALEDCCCIVCPTDPCIRIANYTDGDIPSCTFGSCSGFPAWDGTMAWDSECYWTRDVEADLCIDGTGLSSAFCRGDFDAEVRWNLQISMFYFFSRWIWVGNKVDGDTPFGVYTLRTENWSYCGQPIGDPPPVGAPSTLILEAC